MTEADCVAPAINFLARGDNFHTIQSFVAEWAPTLAARLRLWTYQEAGLAANLPPGLWIFADVDQFSPAGLANAAGIWQRLAGCDGAVCLNRPGVVLPRQALLERLHATGWNRFAVYPPHAWRDVARFPVFIRHRTTHNGAITDLLADRETLGNAVAAFARENIDLTKLLIVECLDTSEHGVFRKYSAFRIGGTILPHHIFHAAHWHVKAGSLELTAGLVAEERVFQRDNPHLEQLREIFEIAGIDYGRIDYAMFEGRVQTWEINTNPTLLQPRATYTAAQLPAKRWFAESVVDLLNALAVPAR